jgi:hypothetical protein
MNKHGNRLGIVGITLALILAVGMASPKTAKAHNALGTCVDTFSSQFALQNIYAQARDSFAYFSGFDAQGRINLCANSVSGVCWDYRHRCVNDYIDVVDESGFGHFHLGLTNISTYPGFACFGAFGDPGDWEHRAGQEVAAFVPWAGPCIIPDWTTQARNASGHDGRQWIGIHLDGGNTVFNMTRISSVGRYPIQLWYHSVITGSWFFWSSIPPGNYNLPIQDADLVELSSASGQAGNNWQIAEVDIED